MKLRIPHILPLLLTACLTACTDDFTPAPGTVPATPTEYLTECSIELEIDGAPQSRSVGVGAIDLDGLKTSWAVNDKVILTTNDNQTFEFKCYNTPGARATFKLVGSNPIPNPVSGTLTYVGASTSVARYNGYVMLEDFTANFGIAVHEYDIQSSNDNTNHLKYADRLSASFTNLDLSSGAKLSLKRNFSILKIVLDDFYYPVYDGSMLFVMGLKRANGAGEAYGRCMTLGVNEFFKKDKEYDKTLFKYDGTVKTPNSTKYKKFCDVSTTKRPFTGYAARDNSHKIVAYMVLDEECMVEDGDVITVGLRDQWSFDWYFWQTMPLKALKLPFGSFYTLDFTKSFGGRYQYESTAALHSGSDNQYSGLGHIATKNVGAKSLTDPGYYYMFGYDRPLKPGDFYFGHPDITPYYFYYYDDSEDYKNFLRFNPSTNGATFSASFYQIKVPKTYNAAGTFVGPNRNHLLKKTTETGNGKYPRYFWRDWVEELRTLPTVYPEGKLSWTPMTTLREDAAKNIPLTNSSFIRVEVIGSSGQPNTPDPVGVRLILQRTGHAIFIPISGLLDPSDSDYDPETESTEHREHRTRHHISGEATARIKPGTESYAAMGTYCLHLPPFTTDDERTALQVVFAVDINSPFGTDPATVRQLDYDLNIAMPIRPIFKENDANMDHFRDFLNSILPYSAIPAQP